MLLLLASLAVFSRPLTYQEARALALQAPYASEAERRGARVATRKGTKDGEGWTFRLFARDCVLQSCLIGWVHVDRGTGEITDPVSEKPINSRHLTVVEADLRQ